MKKHAAEETQAKVTEEKTSVGSKIVGTIINIVLVLAIILAFICTYTSYTTKKGSGVPNILGYEPFAIQTNSMSPFFDAGDLIIDRALDDYSDCQVGDVITFWTIIDGEQVLNTHRIVAVEHTDDGYTCYYTKGDANDVEDSLMVYHTDVVGVYWTQLKGVGNVLDFLQTSKGFFVCIVLPIFAFFLYYLVNFFRILFEYQGEKKRLEFEREYEIRQQMELKYGVQMGVVQGAQPGTEQPAPQPQPVAQPTPAPQPQPVVQPAPQPAAQPVAQPTPAPQPQPVVQPAPQPAAQPVAQPTPAPQPQPVVQPAPQPAAQPVAQPAPQPQPVVQPAPQPAAQPVAQPAPAPTPQPVAQPAKADDEETITLSKQELLELMKRAGITDQK